MLRYIKMLKTSAKILFPTLPIGNKLEGLKIVKNRIVTIFQDTRISRLTALPNNPAADIYLNKSKMTTENLKKFQVPAIMQTNLNKGLKCVSSAGPVECHQPLERPGRI